MSSFADQIIAEGNVEKVESMLVEIERLRADVQHWRMLAESHAGEILRLRAALRDVDAVMDFTERNATIEECARVADAFANEGKPSTYIPAAIRALKDAK